MLLKHRTPFAILFISFLISASCRKGGKCEEPLNVNQSEIVVTFIDQATGKHLYSETDPLYNKDSLKVFDPLENNLVILSALNQIPNTSDRYYVLSFGNIYNDQTDQASFNSEICKDYVIKYSLNESDTVKVCFKSKRTKCGSVFETLKVYHNDQLVGSESNKTSVSVTLFKN